MNHPCEQAVRQSGAKPCDGVVVGVSGGADSSALLHALVQCGYRVTVCHVNHCLRGEESDADARFVKERCESYNVPYFERCADVFKLAKEQKCTVEEAGRLVRYSFFEEIRQKTGAKFIMTAHTKNDQVETVLYRMARGTGLHGLCGIPKKRGVILRPFLSVTREEIEAYCRDEQIAYRTDSTNKMTVYARNRVRHEVIPALCTVHPGAVQAIARMTQSLSIDEDYLSLQTAKRLSAMRMANGKYDCRSLVHEHPAIVRRAALAILNETGAGESEILCERLCALFSMASGSMTAQNGVCFFIRRGVLTVGECIPASPYAFTLSPGMTANTPYGTVRCEKMTRDDADVYQKVYKNLLYLALDYDTIKGQITLRSRADGDRFCSAKTGVTKKIKKLFSEAGFTPLEKSAVPIVCDETGVIGVTGFGAKKGMEVSGDTTNVLLFIIDKTEE